jgi:hypothetical protein
MGATSLRAVADDRPPSNPSHQGDDMTDFDDTGAIDYLVIEFEAQKQKILSA